MNTIAAARRISWVSGSTIAMGWLFGCFGGGRREKLPRLCSRRHHHKSKTRDYPKSQPKLSPFGTTLGSGRPLLRNGESSAIQQQRIDLRLANHCRRSLEKSEEAQNQLLREEVSHLRSCGIAIQTPEELRKSIQPPIWDLPTTQFVAAERETPTCQNMYQIPEEEPATQEEEVQSGLSSSETANNNLKSENPQAVPVSKVSGFFMFPRKRSAGYRSFVWQEPLSPVAEAESSVSSEEEEEEEEEDGKIIKPSCAPVEHINPVEGSKGFPAESPVSSCESKSAASDSDITPVRCSSPDVDKSNFGEAGQENENIFLRIDNALGGRQNQTSVLTPVGNLLQWRQLKEDIRVIKSKVMEVINSSPTQTEDKGDEGEFDVENYSFFKELQQSSTEISPQLRSAAASRWGYWDGQGIPNTTRKYQEDQKVTWHSTPFQVRLDKALASQLITSEATAPSPRVLF